MDSDSVVVRQRARSVRNFIVHLNFSAIVFNFNVLEFRYEAVRSILQLGRRVKLPIRCISVTNRFILIKIRCFSR